MATQLDLEEQEQLEQVKAFWARWGTLVTAALVIVLGGYLAWIGWNAWQRDQAGKAGAMYDELERAVRAGDAAAGTRIFTDIRDRYPRTVFAAQAGLESARLALGKGQRDEARGALAWVADSAGETGLRDTARLRLAGLLAEDGKADEALKQLDAVQGAEFQALAADRRGDILKGQGKADEARAAYRKAWDALDPKVDYRRVVEAKLDLAGAAPVPASGVITIEAAAAASTVAPTVPPAASAPASGASR